MTIPALRQTRRIFNSAEITLMVRPHVAGLFREADFVDEVFQGDDRSTRDALRIIKELKSRKYDIALLLPNAFSAALITYLARIPTRIGYPTDGRGLLLTHRIQPDQDLKKRHQVYYYLNLVAEAEKLFYGRSEAGLVEPEVTLSVSPRRREEAWEFLESSGVDARKKLVVINPGALNSRAKRWLPERFAAVGEQILARGDASVVLIGTQQEREIAEGVSRGMQQKPILLAGKTSLEQLVAILSCARLLISNDTGAAHIGAALGVPTLVIFGPTEDYATRPFSPSALVIKKGAECSPCMLRDCPTDHRCMRDIEIEDVLRPAIELLDREVQSRV